MFPLNRKPQIDSDDIRTYLTLTRVPDELLQVKSPDSIQRGAYTASDKALRYKKSLATTDYVQRAYGGVPEPMSATISNG